MVFETSFFRDNVKSPKPELDKCPCRWRNEHRDHVERGDDWNEEVETIEHASDRVAGKKCEERLRKRCRNAQQMSKLEASSTHACAHNNVISVEHVLRYTHDRGKSLGRKKRKTSRKNRSAGSRQLVANKTSNACTFDSSRLARNRFSCRRETIRFFQDQLVGPCDAQMSMWAETLGMWTSPTQKKKDKAAHNWSIDRYKKDQHKLESRIQQSAVQTGTEQSLRSFGNKILEAAQRCRLMGHSSSERRASHHGSVAAWCHHGTR